MQTLQAYMQENKQRYIDELFELPAFLPSALTQNTKVTAKNGRIYSHPLKKQAAKQ